MHRVLFRVGDFPVYSYGVFVLLGFLAAYLVARRRAERYGLSQAELADAVFWSLVFGILGGRIGFILQELPYYREHPDELWSLHFSGLTSFGGILGGFLFLCFFAWKRRKPVRSILDMASAPALLGHAIGRVGCLLNGCCYGGACDLPWAVPVEGREGRFHPAQIYDSLMTLAMFFALLWLERRFRMRPGQSFAFYLVAFGSARFVYEFWRAGVTSTTIGALPWTQGHLAAALMAAFGVALFVVYGRRRHASESGVADDQVPAGRP
jgi:phosphatidylglycerol:prolipoprotein diacylglycerol transferase